MMYCRSKKQKKNLSRYLGSQMARSYQRESLASLLAKNNLRLQSFSASPAESQILAYYEQKTIYLNDDKIKECQEVYDCDDFRDMVIAHEIFHFLEEKWISISFDSEIAADTFMKVFLKKDLNFKI